MAGSEQNHKQHSGVSIESDDVTTKIDKHMELAEFHMYKSPHSAKYFFHSVYHVIRWVCLEYSTCIKTLPHLLREKNTIYFPLQWVLAQQAGFCVIQLV
jgi:hypothetical protein